MSGELTWAPEADFETQTRSGRKRHLTMNQVTWFEPTNLDEAIALLADHGPGARPLAGGTELIAKMNTGLLQPECLVDLSGVPGLHGITDQGAAVRIGPLTTFRQLSNSRLIQTRYPVLAIAATKIGGAQVQNLGTLGGNICNAEPCADAAAACIALRATVVIRGPGGERRMPLEDVFASPGETVLEQAEILTDILLPPWPFPIGGAYAKLSLRRAMDQALVAVGVSLSLDSVGRCAEVGVGLATSAPTPMRAWQAEALLRGQAITQDGIRQAGMLASQEAQPRDSRKASAAYRRQAIAALAEQALRRAFERACDSGSSDAVKLDRE
jgi:CO/xanthine dehydrogenase FAD-binding subunit